MNGEGEFCRDEDENWHDYVPADTLELLIDQWGGGGHGWHNVL